MKIIAIIPARGGSKRLKNKNTKPLNGKPLIHYTIDEALQCDMIDNIYVTTDDDDIKKTSLEKNVKIINRPENLAHDLSSTVSAIKHAIDELKLDDNDFIITLQATNPLRPKNLIKNALNTLLDKKALSLFSVSLNEHKLGQIKNDKFYPVNYQFGQRSQDMQKLYYENGLIYITQASLIRQDIIFNSDSIAYEIDNSFPIVDIDYEKDFKYAEFLLKELNNG